MSSKETAVQYDILRPFGPHIGRFSIPEKIVNQLNAFTEAVAKDAREVEKFDHSGYLAGEVTQEFQVSRDIVEGELGHYLMNITSAYVGGATGKKVTRFKITGCWIVRSFAGDFNPPHVHSAHVSGAGYLLVPPQIGQPEGSRKGRLSAGNINFLYSSDQFLSTGHVEMRPEAGQMFLFPHYLLHSVNPFFGEGERRSFSFNALVDDQIFDVYAYGSGPVVFS